MLKRFAIFTFTLFLSTLTIFSQYKIPPAEVLEVLETEAPPSMSFIPFSTLAVKYSFDRMPSLKRISEPVVGLAGIEFSPRLNATMQNFLFNSLSIINFKTNMEYTPDFDIEEGIRSFDFNPDRTKCAVPIETKEGIALYIIDIIEKSFHRVPDILINDCFGHGGYSWIDNEHLLIYKIPSDRGAVPPKPDIPISPIIDESDGTEGIIFTFQNLLSSAYDMKLFDYYFTSQPVIYNVNIREKKALGRPGIYDSIDFSPDFNFVLVSKIERPYSYIFPYYFFPKTIKIWNMDGETVRILHERPLLDNLPRGGTHTGPRHISWQPHYDAALIWVEALDGGNPQKEAEHRDRIMRLEAPFDRQAREIIRVNNRFSSIDWSEKKDICIIGEYDRDRVWRTTRLFNINSGVSIIISDLSARDIYNAPGSLVQKRLSSNQLVFIHRDNTIYYNNRRGATPEGNLPYIGKYDYKEKSLTILYRSATDSHEVINGFYGKGFDKITIRSEKPDVPQNYFIVDLSKDERTRLSFNENPHPHLTDIKRELITYTREDGVMLSGTLYYPLEYEEGKRFPLIINAYPLEYTDPSVAQQIDSSPNRFMTFRGASPLFLTLRGYAVLMGAAIPIVGDPETVNDTFIDQTIASVKAAIDHLDGLGIIDPDRVGITGHSYGAFMVATVLGNSDLCKTGIARSGAYNRTLTPFGFQGERRTLWEAPDFYINISPFMYADRIKAPILFIHGEKDPNRGTYPIQTERMFQAVKANGGTARMVILPYEGHGYFAKESVMHVLAEMIEWFDRYL